jgi:hypothetical protein
MGNDRSPLLMSALAALEREAVDNFDAARLLEILEGLCPLCWGWSALEMLNRFDGRVRSRPALVAVLLRELSAAFPVPRSLLH